MIWTIIAFGLLILGIVCFILIENVNLPFIIKDFLEGVSIICLLIGIVGSILVSVFILFIHTSVDYKIQRTQIVYDGLVKRLEIINSDYYDISKSDVIKDVSEWNLDVYSNKHWGDSKWTNWFYSKKYVDSLKYIELVD